MNIIAQVLAFLIGAIIALLALPWIMKLAIRYVEWVYYL